MSNKNVFYMNSELLLVKICRQQEPYITSVVFIKNTVVLLLRVSLYIL